MTKRHKSKQSFTYGIAAYPTKWEQYVISPEKICIQFKTVQCKTRAPNESEGLNKTKWGTWSMPIDTQGTDINILALGVPIKLYPEVLSNIKEAVVKHDSLYPEHSILNKVREIFKDV